MSESANGLAASEKWLIRPERVRRIATGAAGRNIQIASLIGEIPTLTADWLEGLYYKTNGRCAISQIKMTDPQDNPMFAMELDHILPTRKNERIKAAVDGQGRLAVTGDVASKDNVRWVCKAAHRLRHCCENYGLDLYDFCRSVGGTIQNGCELDVNAAPNVVNGMAFLDAARNAISELTFNGSKYISFSDIFTLLHKRGIMIAEYAARTAMKDVVGDGKQYAKRLRHEALRQLLADQPELSAAFLNVDGVAAAYLRCNKFLSGQNIPEVSGTQLSADFKRLGIRASRRSYCNRTLPAIKADVRSRLWNWAKLRGPNGFSFHEAVAMLKTSATHVELALNDGVTRRLLDIEGSKFFGRITRREASKLVGMSALMLKKYASLGTGPVYELSKPGVGTATTYSFAELAQWRDIHPQRKRSQKNQLMFS